MKSINISYKVYATLPVSVKVRNDYVDYDYLQQLNFEELNWLKGFHREFVQADFKHRFKKHYKSNKSKRIIYGFNNDKNRDTYNIAKWTGNLLLSEEVGSTHNNLSKELPKAYEDYLIKLLDYLKETNVQPK